MILAMVLRSEKGEGMRFQMIDDITAMDPLRHVVTWRDELWLVEI